MIYLKLVVSKVISAASTTFLLLVLVDLDRVGEVAVADVSVGVTAA